MLRTRRSVAPLRRPIVITTAVAVALVAGATAALAAPLASSAATGQGAAPAMAPAATSTVTDAQKLQRVIDDTNEVRAEAGTTPLVRNSALDKVAADWAYQQWKNGAMSHNPNYSTQIPKGWSHAGENVAAGYAYDEVVPAWVKSPEHYKNLVGDYTDIGIGSYEGADGDRYWSQVFAKYSTTQVPPQQTPSTSTSSAAEPAAPAGQAIALSSPSFEGSTAGWTASGAILEGPVSTAKGGRYDLAASGGTTVSQSVTTEVEAGDSVTATIWVKPGSSSAVAGSLKVSTIGGTTEAASLSFRSSQDWMQLSITLPVTKAGHTGLTLEVALTTSGAAYRLDSASLVRTPSAWVAAPARVDAGSSPALSTDAAAAGSPSSAPSSSSSSSPTAPAAGTPATSPSSSPSSSPSPASPGIGLGLGRIGLGG